MGLPIHRRNVDSANAAPRVRVNQMEAVEEKLRSERIFSLRHGDAARDLSCGGYDEQVSAGREDDFVARVPGTAGWFAGNITHRGRLSTREAHFAEFSGSKEAERPGI